MCIRDRIEDKRTVYGECTYRLVPREDEPSVCLMQDVYKRQEDDFDDKDSK